MKRVFKIDEVVWYSEDHERGWGKVGLINRSDKYPEYNCCDDDILTIEKEGGGEIECSPSHVYQVAQDLYDVLGMNTKFCTQREFFDKYVMDDNAFMVSYEGRDKQVIYFDDYTITIKRNK